MLWYSTGWLAPCVWQEDQLIPDLSPSVTLLLPHSLSSFSIHFCPANDVTFFYLSFHKSTPSKHPKLSFLNLHPPPRSATPTLLRFVFPHGVLWPDLCDFCAAPSIDQVLKSLTFCSLSHVNLLSRDPSLFFIPSSPRPNPCDTPFRR